MVVSPTSGRLVAYDVELEGLMLSGSTVTTSHALPLRKSDNLFFELAFGDERSHRVGNRLLYRPAFCICDLAQRSQHFLIELINRPIADPKCDNLLRDSFHVISCYAAGYRKARVYLVPCPLLGWFQFLFNRQPEVSD